MPAGHCPWGRPLRGGGICAEGQQKASWTPRMNTTVGEGWQSGSSCYNKVTVGPSIHRQVLPTLWVLRKPQRDL